MSAQAGSIRAGRAFVEIFTDSSEMARGLKAASRKLAAWGASVRNLGLKFSAAGAAIVTPLVDSARRWAEAGAEMAPRLPDGADHLTAKLVRELAQLLLFQLSQFRRIIDRIEQRGLGILAHDHGLTLAGLACR